MNVKFTVNKTIRTVSTKVHSVKIMLYADS